MKRTANLPSIIAATLLFAFAATGLAAQAPTARPGGSERPDFLKGDPGFAELGVLPDPLSARELGKAALLASGVAPDRSADYESRLGELYDALRTGPAKDAAAKDAAANADPAAQGEAILGYLHERVFKAYGENATTLDGILDKGLYNCVSSAVLYMLAAKSLGLEVEGVRTSDHAFCSLLAGNRRIDVETTNAFGFDPGNKKEFKDSFGRATGYAYVAPGGYGDRKAIGDRALIGLILSNRASMLEYAGRFVEATRLGVDYDELCRDADSRDFLDARINNLVAYFESRRDYEQAEKVARAAAEAFPGEARLIALARAAAYNKAAAHARVGDWAGAFDLAVAQERELEGATPAATGAAVGTASIDARELDELASTALSGLAQSYANRGEYALARGAVAERAKEAGSAAARAAYAAIGETELVSAANGLPFAKAEETVDRIYAAGEVDASRYAQAMATIYGNEAGKIGSGGDWLGGAALAERGAAKLIAAKAPVNDGLVQLARSLRHNFVAEAHNRFARLYNTGDFAGAEAEIERALASMPGDPNLERDLKDATAAKAAKAAKD
jgi:hypothetical protein